MNFNKNTWMLVVALGLGACGGGDENETENKTIRYTAIDGYLSNADVYIDKNQNGVAEAEEKIGVTDAYGQVDVPADSKEYPVIVRVVEGQTVDSDYEGVATRSYEMITDVGNTFVTPFTTFAHISQKSLSDLLIVLDPDGSLGLTGEMLTGDYIAMAKEGEDAAIVAHILGRSVALTLKDSLVNNYDADGLSTTDLELHITEVSKVVKEQVENSSGSVDGIAGIEDMVVIVTIDENGNVVDKTISSTSDYPVYNQIKFAINDTGITQCYDQFFGEVPCTDGDDTHYGRDSDTDLNSDINGALGFNFSKISSAGVKLTADAAEWNCVQDNITGLMWEIKTPANEGGLRDAAYKYPWYNPDNTTNGGEPGTPGNDDCLNGDCDTSQYVSAINSEELCGFSDWRLPNREELQSIVHYGGGTTVSGEGCDYFSPCPSIDGVYFPHTQRSAYWSSTPKLFGTPRLYDGVTILFTEGNAFRFNIEYTSSNDPHVRLVRADL